MARRERMRTITQEEIKALARRQMAEGGTAAISLNAIARAMDLTAPALYHYFASREALLTALIIDAYNQLADALAAAAAAHPATAYAERLYAASLAYRGWALEHPTDFLLIFGNPIPGYDAPADQTSLAARRVFAVFLNQMQAAADAGKLRLDPRHIRLAPSLCPLSADEPDHTADPEVRLAGIAAWTVIHGIVILELVGQLHHTISNGGQFYAEECRALLAGMGLELADTS